MLQSYSYICEHSYRIIMFHFMLCSSFYDKAIVFTSDKREPETKGQRIQDYRQFVILKHFTFHQSLSLYIYSFCYSVLVPRKFYFPLKTGTAQLTTTLNYFTCLCACFGIITVFNFIICQNVVCLNPKGDQVVIEPTFKVMKIQYSRNHRDLEGEQAMKTKQSLKWHPDSILDLINLPRLMLHCGHLKYLI